MKNTYGSVRVLMVGPDMSTRGGIAEVLRVYSSSELPDLYDVTWIPTTGHGAWGTGAAFFSAAWKVVRTCRASRTLVHLHVASRGSYLRKAVLARLALWCGARIVFHVHGGGFSEFFRSSPAAAQSSIRRLMGRVDRVVALSPEWATRLSEIAPAAVITVVPNPVNMPTGVPGAKLNRCWFAGRLTAEKGVFDLVEAIDILQREAVVAEWVLAGEGDDGRLQAAVEALPQPDMVKLPGWLEKAEMDSLQRESRVFCLPSHVEGFPMALLQAMSHGAACVVTPVGGVPDVVNHGKNGLVVPVSNPRALADSLRRVLGDECLSAQLGERARRDAYERYSTHTVIRRVVDLYRELGFDPGEAT